LLSIEPLPVEYSTTGARTQGLRAEKRTKTGRFVKEKEKRILQNEPGYVIIKEKKTQRNEKELPHEKE
jgi:hypothetical protein